AVEADLEVQHVTVGAGTAHFRDLLASLHVLALVHQALAVVAIGRQPLLVVLDDDQFAITDQARAGIHHHAVGGGLHRLPAGAGDVHALPGGHAGRVTADDGAVSRPAPADVALHRRRTGNRRRSS